MCGYIFFPSAYVYTCMNFCVSSLGFSGVVLAYMWCGSESSVLPITSTVSHVLFFISRGKEFSLLLDCKQIIKGNYPFWSIWEAYF